MGAAAEFDIGPLTWVKGEIEQALAKAGVAVTAYLADPAASTQIKFCKMHLHQAHGALEIVGLDGVTRLTEESERLLDLIESGQIVLDAAKGQVLLAAFAALAAYLDEVVEGAPHQPVRLFPAYQAVMQARGAERISESDLFFPDLSARPPKREVADLPADMREHVLAQRRRFQSGLLRWLRNGADAAALKDMAEAVRAIERTQAMPQHRAFWWITIGFAETLQEAGASPGVDAKRLCARIDLQMKRLMEGSQNVAERLMRDALYFVAKSRASSGSVKELRAFYHLEGAVPDQIATHQDSRPHEAHLRAIRDILGAAKEKWNKFSAGQTHELAGFREQAGQLKERTAALGNADFARLANAISAVTVWVAENPDKVTESIALETATALLLAENATDNFARLGEEFTGQVAAMGARLKASLSGQAADAPAVPLLDEMSRKAQERLLMAQVASEISSNLGSIETALDAFFRDSSKRAELSGLERQVKQVLGALMILGADQAAAALTGCQASITRFAQPDYAPQQADFEDVAHIMSALGFYVEALQHGPANFDEIMNPAAPASKQAAADRDDPGASFLAEDGSAKKPSDLSDAPALTVEAELEQEKKDARTLFDAWRQEPQDALLTAELKANLEAIKNDAELVDDPTLRMNAAHIIAALSEMRDAAGLPGLDQMMSRISPAIVVPAPAATAAPATAASAPPVVVPAAVNAEPAAAPALPADEAVDAELLSIFLEEALEVLQTIGTQHGLAKAEPANKEVLTVIRRAFHTLKGSGRMVGLMRFGDAAWSVEQTMNQWLQEAKPADRNLLALIEAADRLFERWVSELSASGVSGADGRLLIAAAQRMQAGQPFEIQAAATAAAAPAPAPAAIAPASVAPFAFAPPAAALQAVPAEPAAAVAGEAAADTLPADHTILIGDIRVSPGLYNIFVEESAGHVAVMNRELALLASEPQPPRDELVRAAHTLTGIAGTVNFKQLNELGRAFERLLLAAMSGRHHLDATDRALAQEAVDACAAMLAAVTELKAPPAADDLAARLEVRRAEWVREGETAGPMLADLPLPAVQLPDAPVPAPASAVADRTPAVEIDFSSFGVAPDAEAPSAPVASEPVEPAADFSFHIEDINLPPVPAAPAEVPVAAPAEPMFAFIDDSAPAAAPLAAPTAVQPDLGNTTILRAAGGALDSAAFEQLAALRSTTLAASVASTLATPAVSIASAPAEAPTAAAPASAPIPASVPAAGIAPASTPAEAELLARGFDASERRQERLTDEIDEQLLPIFMDEANELMPRIGEQLRAWADGGNAQSLQRSLHTLKGGARMAGAMALGQLTHSMETRVENALQLPNIPPAIFDGLFSSYDRTTMLMEQLRRYDASDKTRMAAASSAALAEDNASKLVSAFDAAGGMMPAGSAEALPLMTAGTAAAPALTGAAKTAEDARAMLRVRADVIDRLVNEAGEVAIARSRIEGEVRSIKASLKDLTENVIRLRAQLREIEIAAESQMQSRQKELEEKHTAFDPLEFDRFSRLQEITRMMAESVNDVATVQQNLLKNLDDADAALLAQGRLSRDLQNDLMRVRMVPFNNVAERLYRVVRQTAKELGKRANLDIRGTQTEIDRSVLERMTGPFEHLLRNAIAHGLEDPQGRAAAGKAEIGQIGLSARQEGNEFVLVFDDDGQGLDIERIRAKALANGLVQEGDQLTGEQIAEFIFAPGFSTAAEVSEVSGRGVGMDVVRAEVVALGGRVQVEFTAGKGSRFTIFLPLTLAVTQVVLVRTGTRLFAVPSAMVEQVRQVKTDEVARAYAAGKFEWQGREYPFNYLPRLLGESAQAAQLQRFTPVLLLRSGPQRAAIHVDEMIGNQEVVVKNIGPQLARVSGIAGATVLGTGQVVLILNPVPLALQMVVSTATPAAAGETAAVAAPPRVAAAAPVSTQPTVMVVDDSLTVRKITSRLLTRENYQVFTAKDGVDALEQLADLRPDVMLVDIEMPRMDGFDLTRNVRSDARLKHIPIIMITSRTADKHRNYAMEIGVNVFLGKPYQETELIEHISYLIKNQADATAAV